MNVFTTMEDVYFMVFLLGNVEDLLQMLSLSSSKLLAFVLCTIFFTLLRK